MNQQPNDSYLEAHVLTAAPQKLRLMLIEAAISAARQTLMHWENAKTEEGLAALIHCRDLLSELLSGITPDESELTRNVAAVYVFLFKTLTEAQLNRDPKLIESTIEVLEVERQTWRMVCDQVPDAQCTPGAFEKSHTEITANTEASAATNPTPHTGGLTLEA